MMGEENIHALNDINLNIVEGELTSIVGTSGSGKSTLMNIIGLLDLPSSGSYILDGINTTDIAIKKLVLSFKVLIYFLKPLHLRMLKCQCSMPLPTIQI